MARIVFASMRATCISCSGRARRQARALSRPIDGAPPGDDHGADTDAEGRGIVTEQRLYQLVRQGETGKDRTFEIEFLDPGAQAFAFTFG